LPGVDSVLERICHRLYEFRIEHCASRVSDHFPKDGSPYRMPDCRARAATDESASYRSGSAPDAFLETGRHNAAPHTDIFVNDLFEGFVVGVIAV
jgi:hypothetical protein